MFIYIYIYLIYKYMSIYYIVNIYHGRTRDKGPRGDKGQGMASIIMER